MKLHLASELLRPSIACFLASRSDDGEELVRSGAMCRFNGMGELKLSSKLSITFSCRLANKKHRHLDRRNVYLQDCSTP